MIERPGARDPGSMVESARGSCDELAFGCRSSRSFVAKALGVNSNAQISIHGASTAVPLCSSDSSGASEHVHTHPRKLPKIAIGRTKARSLISVARRSIIGNALYTTAICWTTHVRVACLTPLLRRLSSPNYHAPEQSKDSNSRRTSDRRGRVGAHPLHRRKALLGKP